MKSILAFPKTTYKTRFQNDGGIVFNNRSLSSTLNTPINSSSRAMGKGGFTQVCHPVSIVLYWLLYAMA
jgi:hypothetical protein